MSRGPHFCWPMKYTLDGRCDELRLSIRSVLSSFPDANITVIGDCPEWYSGHHISTSPVPSGKNSAYRDTLQKLRILMNHPDINDEFVWMNDDVYLIRHVTMDELKTSRADFIRVLDDNSWRKLKNHTIQYMKDRGNTGYDYATHLPHVLVKSNLHVMFDCIDFTEMKLWEICYGNLFWTTPTDYAPFLVRILRRETVVYLNGLLSSTKVLNNSASAWGTGLSTWLYRQFPLRSFVERDY